MIKLAFRVACAFAIAWMLIPHRPGWADNIEAIMKLAADAAKFVMEKV
jgi:hypothetical protein